jgi:formylglycine-generating enzyme required for sulfatase activity
MSGYCNSWEGAFPKENAKKDGYVGVAPVDAYKANGYGLYNMVGNVWEWTADGTKQEKVLRGGSYVDTLDGSANHLLRVSTRMVNSPDSGGANTGFRCARTLEKKARIQKKQPKKKKAAPRRRSDEL